MPVIRLNANDKTITLRKSTNAVTLKQVGRRGIQGQKGDKGDKGDQGDPATNLVQSVNGKQGVVVLDSTDVGADPTGSASQALQDAKDYTDTEVSTLDSSLATVAKTGSYDDLSNKPTIPSIAGLATEAQVQDVQDNLDAHEADTANPHSVTKAQVGLGNVDNTSDANKPVSTATQTALNGKATKLTLDAYSIPYRDSFVAGEAASSVKLVASSAEALSAARRTSSGTLFVATPGAAGEATTKAYVDAADALKVNKAGDTMTGALWTQSVAPGATLTYNLGTTSRYYSNAYARNVQLNAVSSIDGASGGVVNLVGSRLKINSSAEVITGTGFPNGVVSAPVGSTYIDTAATNGAIEWKKATGTGPTGWVVSVGDTGLRDITSLSNATSGKLFVYRTAQGIVFVAEDLIIPNTATTTWGVIAGPIATSIGPFEIARSYNDTVQDNANRLFINNGQGIRGWQLAGTSYRYNFTTPPIRSAAWTQWPSTLPGTAA